MRSIRTILALTAIFGFAAGSATADETYYFDVADGNWNVPGNWYPTTGGPPGPGDTAIIQGDRHCHVTTYSEECKVLKVLDGATLSLEAPCLLRLGDANVATTSIIGGTVRFMDDTDVGDAWLTIHQGGVTLASANGGGKLTASEEDECGPGQGLIATCCAATQVLTVSPVVTVKGDLHIYVNVENNGAFVVDHADDEMIFDRFADYARPKITGDGSFDVSAGTLTFDDCLLPPDNTTTWNLSVAGTIHITSECCCAIGTPFHTACAINITGGELWVERADPGDPPPPPSLCTFKTIGEFNMSAGTLDIDGGFKVTGGAQISGGKIEVAPGKSAEFRHPQ